MEPFVNISISAPVGTGKSTIARVIYDALTEAGFEVAISDLDDINFRGPPIGQRIDMMKDKLPIVLRTEAMQTREIAMPKFKPRTAYNKA